MKRIGILTVYYQNYNFGGQLQAYALQSFLSQCGYDAEQIQFDYYASKEKRPGFLRRNLVLLKHKFLNSEIYDDEIKLIKRKKRFNKFINSIPHSSKIYQETNISELNKDYDCLVCGGDQIWNDWDGASWTCSNALSIFSLGFVDNCKIAFSYAPSLGRPVLTENQKSTLKKSFGRMQGISIREKSNLSEISCLTDKKVHVVVDPVFLLTCEDWDSLINDKTIKGDDYAFCYFLSNDLCRAECVKGFAKSNELITICVPNCSGNMTTINRNEEWGDINDYESGPIEFIKRIRDSKIVLTDSFHAVVFSIIFHKQFYVFGRTDGNSEMNNRLYDLLDDYDLKDRYISDASVLLTMTDKIINYESIDSIININREKSLKFIMNCIREIM